MKYILIVLSFIFVGAVDASTIVHPIEKLNVNGELWPEIQRQRVNSLQVGPGIRTALTLRLDDCLDREIYFDVPKGCVNVDTLNHSWVVAKDENPYAFKNSGQRLTVRAEGSLIFNSMDHPYDHIAFRGVCETHRSLVFDLTMLGTANGDVYKVLVLYYDSKNNGFRHQIAEPAYLSQCGIEETIFNR